MNEKEKIAIENSDQIKALMLCFGIKVEGKNILGADQEFKRGYPELHHQLEAISEPKKKPDRETAATKYQQLSAPLRLFYLGALPIYVANSYQWPPSEGKIFKEVPCLHNLRRNFSKTAQKLKSRLIKYTDGYEKNYSEVREVLAEQLPREKINQVEVVLFSFYRIIDLRTKRAP